MLRDQHRRERQREKDRRESGVGLLNYRPWRYSAILSFLNPFIDARAAGTNGWALDPQPSQLQATDMGCSTTTEARSDDDDICDVSVVDATTTSSSSSDFVRRKRSSSAGRDAVRLKEAKTEVTPDECVQVQQQDNMKQLLETMMQSVTSLAATLASSHCSTDHPAAPAQSLKTEEQEAEEAELSDQTDEEEEQEEQRERSAAPARPTRAKRKSSDVLLEEYLRRTEAREAQRDQDQRDQRDDVTLFLLSLAPAMRRLPAEKQSWVRTKMQQFVHEAQFGASSFH